jgi:hypothetical protein
MRSDDGEGATPKGKGKAMTDLSQDELTILLIAAKGEPMMPVGPWKPSAESLVAKGYLKAHPSPQDPSGMFNLHITPAGRAAAEQEDTAYDRQLGEIINKSNAIGHQQAKARAAAEQIAVQLVDLAEMSSQTTGDDKITALRNWARIILERALEKMQ